MYYAIGLPPYIYIYNLCNYSIYIYYLIGLPTHTYIYIYILNPITLLLSHHSSNSWLLLLLYLSKDGGDAGLNKCSNS